jgi:hypothetical protein
MTKATSTTETPLLAVLSVCRPPSTLTLRTALLGTVTLWESPGRSVNAVLALMVADPVPNTVVAF